jgi:hypothetical protein
MTTRIAQWGALAGGDTLTFCTAISGFQVTTHDVNRALDCIRNEIASWPKYRAVLPSGGTLAAPVVVGIQLGGVFDLLPNTTFEVEQ